MTFYIPERATAADCAVVGLPGAWNLGGDSSMTVRLNNFNLTTIN